MLMAGGSVQTEVTKESVQETLREFQEITDSRPVTPEELATSKAGILRAYPASFERAGLILNHLVQQVQFDLPDDYFQTVRPGISAVSLDEAHRIARERISSERLQILVVGDAQTVEAGLKELGLPLVRLDADGARLE